MNDFRSAVRYSAALYVTSDEMEISYCLRVSAPKPISEIGGDIDMAAVIEHFAGNDATALLILGAASDWRPMTPDEIADYEADYEAADA